MKYTLMFTLIYIPEQYVFVPFCEQFEFCFVWGKLGAQGLYENQTQKEALLYMRQIAYGLWGGGQTNQMHP